MKNIEASVGAVPTRVEEIRKKTFEKIFEKMQHAKAMEVDVQKRENDFFWEYIKKPISTQEERDDRDILRRAAHLRFADEWRAVFQERDEIAEISAISSLSRKTALHSSANPRYAALFKTSLSALSSCVEIGF